MKSLAPITKENFSIFTKNNSLLDHTLVIFAHPYLEHSHSNRQLVNFYERHQRYSFRDIYEDYPDFHIAAFKERKRLKNYNRIIFQFPIIWFGMPPLLKLWMDEVFDSEWLKEDTENPLSGKEIFILITTGGKQGLYTAEGKYGHTIEELISSLTVSLKVFGAEIKAIKTVYEADKLTKKEIIQQKHELISLLKK